jgi:GDP-fucose transporter C1
MTMTVANLAPPGVPVDPSATLTPLAEKESKEGRMSNDHNYVASVVASYWFVSISMVYLNKILMSNKTVSIEAPLFITWFQCVVTALICWGAGELALKFKKAEYEAVAKDEGDDEAAAAKPSFWSQFPKADFNWSVARKVFPLSLIFVGMITFNNLCLMWVEVSFYNVARSLTIVFNVIFSQYILGSYTSPKTMACLGVVMLGFFMGSKGELNFSLLGTVSGVLSSLFVSLNSIFTKKVLPVVDNDHWKLTFYNNMNACILFVPMILVFESPVIIAAFGKQFLSLLFWGAMSVAGFFGFAIGTTSYPVMPVVGPSLQSPSRR